MEVNELKLFKLSYLFASFTQLSLETKRKVVQDYRLNEFSDKDLLGALLHFYLRSQNIKHPPTFTKKEWVVLVLFYGVNMKLNKISFLIRCSKNQVRYYFFSAKHKLKLLELEN